MIILKIRIKHERGVKCTTQTFLSPSLCSFVVWVSRFMVHIANCEKNPHLCRRLTKTSQTASEF